jgi:hypothetical protein
MHPPPSWTASCIKLDHSRLTLEEWDPPFPSLSGVLHSFLSFSSPHPLLKNSLSLKTACWEFILFFLLLFHCAWLSCKFLGGRPDFGWEGSGGMGCINWFSFSFLRCRSHFLLHFLSLPVPNPFPFPFSAFRWKGVISMTSVSSLSLIRFFLPFAVHFYDRKRWMKASFLCFFMGGTFLKAGLEDGEGRINRLRIFFIIRENP